MSQLIRWTPMFDPFVEFDRELTAWPGANAAAWTPRLDVYQTENDVVVEAALPGIDPEKVQVSIENDVLSISGDFEQKSEVEEGSYVRRELRRGHYHRAVALPAAVDGDKAKATYAQGILTIAVPIQERVKPKQVKVVVADERKR